MKLKCIGRDKIEREFNLRVEETDEGYPWFKISHESVKDTFFELILKPQFDGSYMVLMINAHDVYGGYGIPDAILPFAAKHLSTELCSSPTQSEDSWRIEEATKAWKRLVEAGKAEYNEKTDIFWIIKERL